MYDIPEFKYLKTVGTILAQLEAQRGTTELSRKQLESFEGLEDFTEHQKKLLEMILRERGFSVVQRGG
jgi:hypothetical protein